MKNKARISKLFKLVSILESVKLTYLLTISFFAIAATMKFVLGFIKN